MNSEPFLRVGLIAYGYAAKTFHAPLIDATPGLKLTAIATSRPADVIADWPDVVVKTEPDRLITHPGLDLVVIATPNDAQRHPLPPRPSRPCCRQTCGDRQTIYTESA